jgi:hypothetical protein
MRRPHPCLCGQSRLTCTALSAGFERLLCGMPDRYRSPLEPTHCDGPARELANCTNPLQGIGAGAHTNKAARGSVFAVSSESFDCWAHFCVTSARMQWHH